MHRREQRARALGGEHGVLVNLRQHIVADDKTQPAVRLNTVDVVAHRGGNQLLVRCAAEGRVDHVVVAQARNLLRLKALGQRAFHINQRQAAGDLVEDVGIGVAIFHAAGSFAVHLVQVAAHKHQEAAVIRLPALLRLAERHQQLVDVVIAPLHDLDQGLGQLQAALERLRVPGVDLVAHFLLFALLFRLVFVLALGLIQRVRQLALHVVQLRQGGRQLAVRQQGPHVLVALNLTVFAAPAHRAVALELVQHQDAGLALDHARVLERARDGGCAIAAAVLAKAVHLHFDKAVVKTQELGQAPG